MSLVLPQPPARYDAAHERTRNGLIEQALARLQSLQADIDLTGRRFFMEDANGTRHELVIDAAEAGSEYIKLVRQTDSN